MPAIVDNPGALPANRAARPADPVAAVLAAAESAIGVMYRWGGNSLASGVDCSGLVQQAFRAAGIVLPRVSAQQARVGEPVSSLEAAQPGDLLSWENSSRNAGADHIAIYLGNGMMIEAPRRGQPVRVTQVRDGARINRVLNVVRPSTGVAQPALGPNQDRRYTDAALARTSLPPSMPVGPGEQQAIAASGGGLGDDLPDDATDEQVEEYIRKHYPDVADFLANAEIRSVLFESARAGEDHVEVLARLRQTNYWRTHGPESRAFDLLLAQDKRAAEDLIEDHKSSLRDVMLRNGIVMDEVELGEAAKLAIRGGWGEDDVQRWLGTELRERIAGGLPAGETGATADALAAVASQYVVNIPRPALEDWAVRIAEGTATESTFQSYVAGLARQDWSYAPEVLDSLGRGIAPRTFFAPHQQAIADILERAPEEIDLFGDPQWRDVTQMHDPSLNGGKGGRRPMTKGEAEQLARDSALFTKTRAYKSTISEAGTGFARFLGLVA